MRPARTTGWLALALAAGAAVAVTGLALKESTAVAGLLLICPLLAATRLDGARTAAVCCYAVLLAVLLGLHTHGYRGYADPEALLRPAVLVLGGAYATWTARQRTTGDHQLTEVATAAQRAILHPVSFRIAGVSVCARYRSAAPQAFIGGDLYAFANTPTGLRMLIGDVRGKGLDAVRLSAEAIRLFRDCAYTQPDLPSVVRATDERLATELEEEDFITALFAEFAPGCVRLANCGHHPPLHLPLAGPPRLLAPPVPTTPLGLRPAPDVQESDLAPGDRLVFYTDGLAEARNRRGSMFDLGLLQLLCARGRLDAAADAVLTTLTRHTGGALNDDIALILVEADRMLRPQRPRSPVSQDRRPPIGRR